MRRPSLAHSPRFPRMTIRRWMILIAIVAVDLAAIFQDVSHTLATLAFFGTCAAVLISPAMLALIVLADDDSEPT